MDQARTSTQPVAEAWLTRSGTRQRAPNEGPGSGCKASLRVSPNVRLWCSSKYSDLCIGAPGRCPFPPRWGRLLVPSLSPIAHPLLGAMSKSLSPFEV